MDPLVPRLLRLVHAAAEGSQERAMSSGNSPPPLPLLHHAPQLVSEAVSLLSEVGLPVALQLECLQVLRQHLLSRRPYVARVTKETVGRILGLCCGFLESSSTEALAFSASFASPASSVLQLTLEGYRGTLRSADRSLLLRFFQGFVGKKVAADETRLAFTLLGALNAFLESEGAGAAVFAADIHSTCRGFLRGLWKASYDQRTFEELVVYSHLQLGLGGLAADDAREFLDSLWVWVRQYSSRIGGVEKHSSAVLLSSALFARGWVLHSSKSEGDEAAVTASTPSSSVVSASQPDEEEEVGPPTAKRARLGLDGRSQSGLLQALFEETIEDPGVWGPILCAFLQLHRCREVGRRACAIFPPDLILLWLRTLSSDIAVIIGGGSSISGQKSGVHCLWILRVLISLAKVCNTAAPAARVHWKTLTLYLLDWVPQYYAQTSKYTNAAKHSSDLRRNVLWDALHLVAYVFASGLVQPCPIPSALLELGVQNMGSQEPLMLMVSIGSAGSSVTEMFQGATSVETSQRQRAWSNAVFSSLAKDQDVLRMPGMVKVAPRALLATLGFPLSMEVSRRAVLEASDDLEDKWVIQSSSLDRARNASLIPLERTLKAPVPAEGAALHTGQLPTFFPAHVGQDGKVALEERLWVCLVQPLAALARDVSAKSPALSTWMSLVAQTYLCLSEASPVMDFPLDAMGSIFPSGPVDGGTDERGIFLEKLCTCVLSEIGASAGEGLRVEPTQLGLEKLQLVAEAASRLQAEAKMRGLAQDFFLDAFTELGGAFFSEMDACALTIVQNKSAEIVAEIQPAAQIDNDFDTLLDVEMPTAPATMGRQGPRGGRSFASVDGVPVRGQCAENLVRGVGSQHVWSKCMRGLKLLMVAVPAACSSYLEALVTTTLQRGPLPLEMRMDIGDLACCLASADARVLSSSVGMAWEALSGARKEAAIDEEKLFRLLDLVIRLVDLSRAKNELWALHGYSVLEILQTAAAAPPTTVTCLIKFVAALGTVLFSVPEFLDSSEKTHIEKALLLQLQCGSYSIRKVTGEWIARLIGQSAGLRHSVWSFLPGMPFKPKECVAPAYVWVGGSAASTQQSESEGNGGYRNGAGSANDAAPSPQMFETSMLCLAEMMCQCGELEALAAFAFCVNLARIKLQGAGPHAALSANPRTQPLFEAALSLLTDVATSQGYASPAKYVNRHFGFIVWHWVVEGVRWELLNDLYVELDLKRVPGAGRDLHTHVWATMALHPRNTFDNGALSSLSEDSSGTNGPFSACMAGLFAEVAVQTSRESQGSRTLSQSQARQQVRVEIPRIWNMYKAVWQVDEGNYTSGCNDPQDAMEALAAELPNVVAKIVCNVSISAAPPEPLLSKACACDALRRLSEHLEPDAMFREVSVKGSPPALSFLRPAQLAHCLWAVESELEVRKSPEHKRSLLLGLDALIETAVTSDSLNVCTFPHLCKLILKGIRDEATQDLGCDILDCVLNVLLGSSSGKFPALDEQKLELLLKPVIAHIAETLLILLEKSKDPTSLPAFVLLKKIVAESPASVRPYIPPFPKHSWLKKVQQWQERSMESISLKDRVLPLATVFGLQLQTWRNSVEEWTRILQEGSKTGPRCDSAEEEDELVWQLWHAFKHQRDPTIQDMLMSLIAHVGLRGSHLTAIRPAHAASDEHFSPSQQDPGRLTLMMDSIIRSAWQTLVQRPEYHTRREAFLALGRIFTRKSNLGILGGPNDEVYPQCSNKRRPAEVIELQTFFQGCQRIASQFSHHGHDDAIFTPVNEGATVRSLVQDLIYYMERCRDIAPRNLYSALKILSDCSSLAACCDQFAESLLPFVLATLSLFEMHEDFPEISRVREELGELIKARVLMNPTYPLNQVVVIIEALEALRRFRQIGLRPSAPSRDLSAWLRPDKKEETHFWLRISYLDFAEAALRCSAHSTTFLYVEEWLRSQGFTQIHDMPESPSKARVQKILRDVSLKVGEPDTLYCLTGSADPRTQVQVMMHEGRWHEALQGLDILRQTQGCLENDISPWTARCLQGLGCPSVTEAYLAGLPEGVRDDVREIQCEAAWRMSKWDLGLVDEAEMRPDGKEGTYHQGLLSCLSLLSAGQRERTRELVNTVRRGVIQAWTPRALESCSLLDEYVCKLRLLHIVDVAAESDSPQRPLQFLSETDYSHLKREPDAYSQWEPILTLAQIVYQILGLTSTLEQHLLKFVKLSRRAGNLQDSTTALQALKNISAGANGADRMHEDGSVLSTPLQTSMHREIALQDAKLLWEKGLRDAALFLAQQVLVREGGDVPDETQSSSLAAYVRVNCLLGSWLNAAATESTETVYTCFVRAADAAERSEPAQQASFICKTNFELAQFAYQQVRQIQEQVESPEWQAHIKLMKSRQDILEHIGQSHEVGKARQYLSHQRGFQKLDADEVKDLDSMMDSFALCAIRSYGKCLANGEKHDLHAVFRLMRLWFSHKEDIPEINNSVSAVLGDIPSYKFLRLAYQIISQVSLVPHGRGRSAPVTFQGALSALVERLAFEHPYHVLPKVFAISASDEDHKGQKALEYVCNADKVKAAGALLKKFRNCSSQTFETWSQMKTLIGAYQAIAATNVVKDSRGVYTAPVMHRCARDIGKRVAMNAVPVLSTTIPVAQDTRYRTASGSLAIPHMVRFANEICLVGGINCPKKVVAIDSEDNAHSQLVKSEDDMRQDAVMQQVFGVANDLLLDDPATRKRSLSMVRYNVVPFSPSSGLVEWVNDTTPLAEYLYGPKNPEGRRMRACYRECQRVLEGAQLTRDLDQQRKAYEKCLSSFRPYMNRFFLEKFLDPAAWFERRLAYTRSVAVSSIVGHIVGLGDRHLSNILIRNDTAEVVHIDLGIAFDQGQVLKYPERVPFRLTPNIVDGMGVCGVEGVMRRCCQETLRVLRLNRESLMTIIEVFVHDPLYSWALSPVQALQKQAREERVRRQLQPLREKSSDGTALLGETADAQRVLQRVRRKLEGKEKGQILEVKGQVQHLFREAQSKDNLCQMYVGWGAWV